jgi:hypothetical protein
MGSWDLVEIAWFTNKIFFCRFSEIKETFIIFSIVINFVVVVVYMEKWKKAREQG